MKKYRGGTVGRGGGCRRSLWHPYSSSWERRLGLCSGAGWLGSMGREEGAGRGAMANVAARGAQRPITQPGAKLPVRRHVPQGSLGGDRAGAWENLGVFAFLSFPPKGGGGELAFTKHLLCTKPSNFPITYRGDLISPSYFTGKT